MTLNETTLVSFWYAVGLWSIYGSSQPQTNLSYANYFDTLAEMGIIFEGVEHAGTFVEEPLTIRGKSGWSVSTVLGKSQRRFTVSEPDLLSRDIVEFRLRHPDK